MTGQHLWRFTVALINVLHGPRCYNSFITILDYSFFHGALRRPLNFQWQSPKKRKHRRKKEKKSRWIGFNRAAFCFSVDRACALPRSPVNRFFRRNFLHLNSNFDLIRFDDFSALHCHVGDSIGKLALQGRVGYTLSRSFFFVRSLIHSRTAVCFFIEA